MAVIGAVFTNRLLADTHAEAAARSSALPAGLRDQFVEGFDSAARHGVEVGNAQTGGVAPQAEPAPVASSVS